MDPALLRERDAFKKRALSTPVIETKKKKEESSNDSAPKKPKWSNNGVPPPPPHSNNDPLGSKTMYKGLSNVGLSSSYKFGVLTKIVKHLKQKFQDGEDHPLALEEILDETNQLDVSGKIRQWLQTEALPHNPKIDTTFESKYQFKPPLACRDKKSLLRLLKQHDLKGLGGILRDEVVESVPHAERVLKILDPEIITIIRQDKKKVLFYNDRHADLKVDEEFQKHWRSVAVEGIDDAKIEEYLDKQGIRSMQDDGNKKPIKPPVRRKGQRKKQFKKAKDNEHIADELRHYDN
ncbi:transcription initiation factor IIE subunit beta isoform X1 [Folsomia candida]|uniref:Transcription initiation factor IIE subunit beta n=1 Tax=Folsomia candida TaxID=158441 RepID=A0A226EUD7_FOLCA|nr:transcription initiation factor IIE subunit beta isoform X1 [Folsomia candida]XP_021945375.1 transcription initiation factor IIE subunit beta isoform X1 [Folsomia candida]OXA60840.1 Transcription initiation factor IIE subunit beta [Folsomia candida]